MGIAPENLDLSSASLMERFQALLARTVEVCNLLEALADALPGRPITLWREAECQCRLVLGDHVMFGRALIARLLGECPQEKAEHDLLLRFAREYGALEFRAEDLQGLLVDAVSIERHCIGPEALGFALRCHFDALRKHIEWESEVLLPLAGRIVSERRAIK